MSTEPAQPPPDPGASLSLPSSFVGTERLGHPLGALKGGDDRAGLALLDALVEVGATGFDTAASYQMGGSERLLGQWLGSRRLRDRVFLLTKGGHPIPLLKPNRLGIADITRDLHDSLRRLGTEHVDLYLLHRDHPDARLEELVRGLDAHARQGKFRAWGVSNWRHDRILELTRVAERLGLAGPAVSSPQFSLAEWSSPPWKGCVSIAGAKERQARDFYARSGMPVLAYSALGRGFFQQGNADVQPAYVHEANQGKRRRLLELAARRGLDPMQLALAYVHHQDFAVHPVVSVSSAAHFRKNLEAREIEVSAEERRFLEEG